MYVPAAFREDDAERLLALIERWSFGILVSSDASGTPTASHLPFMVERRAGSGRPILVTHMAAANPQARAAADGAPVLAIFRGPHAYVSPAWMADPAHSVPTWNYIAVHARGRAHRVEDTARVDEVLARLTHHHEGPSGWRPDDLEPAQRERLRRALTVLEIGIDDLRGALKLGQNKDPGVRRAIAAGLAASPDPDARAVAGWMRAGTSATPARIRWRDRPHAARHRLRRLRARVATWKRRVRQRVELARLDERARRDVGARWEDAVRECRKPFWQA